MKTKDDEDNLQKRFDTLASKLVDSALNEDETLELIDLGRKLPGSQRALRKQLAMDNLLSQVFAEENAQETFVEDVLAKTRISEQQKAFEARILSSVAVSANDTPTKSSKTPWYISGFSMAACLLLTITYFMGSIKSDNPLSQPIANEINHDGVALIANAVGLAPGSPFRSGEAITPGELKIDQGFLELEFYQGALLKIAGPAHLDIIDEQRVKLHTGKVMTDVPTVAIGFTIDTPNSEVVDLGTAIGVSVDANGDSQVHVFDGLVEARTESGEAQRIEKGDAVNFFSPNTSDWSEATANSSKFEEFSQIDALILSEDNEKHTKWQERKAQTLQDEALVAYYDFEVEANKFRKLKNIAPSSYDYDGAIVGAKWNVGPWPGKSALEFKHPADRVRIDIKEPLKSFTLATWVKIDSLDRQFNSLLLTDGFKDGDLHWQLGNFHNNRFGTFILGTLSTESEHLNYNYSPFFSPADSGTWYHLATTLDHKAQQVSMYINGQRVKETVLQNPSEFWRIGEASIGNWNSLNEKNPLRNLNGSMAELIVFSRVLQDKEISALALN
ncbi:LamG-like jellyroll fold domain-containing protein [Agaribacter flavus]|uniref:LamG-like jellyroll fold domain-containing protein n=1 Tax=Agaribacter flavus TaxID=1902781 RepID=A0ABV7FSA4_9ALTE